MSPVFFKSRIPNDARLVVFVAEQIIDLKCLEMTFRHAIKHKIKQI